MPNAVPDLLGTTKPLHYIGGMTEQPARAWYLDELTLEQTASRVFTVDDAAIRAFADVSHDHNPVHVDDAYALTSPFKGRIAHGMLLGAYISATLASDLPGRGAIYVSQSLNFKRAVRPGDEATVSVTITGIDQKSGHVTLATVVKVRNKTFVDGTAVVIAPKRPA